MLVAPTVVGGSLV